MTNQKGLPVDRASDGYWEWFTSKVAPPMETTGKYLFFSEDRRMLETIALDELANGDFPLAKIHDEGKNPSAEYGLCLYFKDDSRKYKLAAKYKGRPGLKYRYWKSDEETRKGKYSQEFLRQLDPAEREDFTRKKP